MSSPYYTWGNPTLVKPPPPGFAVNARLTVAANQDGHLEVFALGQDGAVWHSWQNYFNIYEWSEWASLGSPGSLMNQGYAMQAVQNEDGRLELFIADDDWNLWHIWQLAANANWIGGWSSLGRPLLPQSTNDVYSIAVSLNDAGAITVLMQNQGADAFGEIFSRSQIQMNGNWEVAWTSLGAPKTPLGDFAIACPPKSLFTQVVVVDADYNGDTRRIFGNRRSSFVANAANWSGWTDLFFGPSEVQFLGGLLLQRNDDNHLELFAFDTTAGNIWHSWEFNGGWSQQWANLGTPAGGNQANFSSALGPDGLIYLVIWGNDNAIHVISQTAKNNGWGNWNFLWKNSNPNPAEIPVLQLISDQDGLLNVFGRDSASRLFYIRQVYHKG